MQRCNVTRKLGYFILRELPRALERTQLHYQAKFKTLYEGTWRFKPSL